MKIFTKVKILYYVIFTTLTICAPIHASNIDIYSLRKSIALGEVSFQVTTNNPEAKEHFLLGAAFLHAFMYDLAIVQFKQAEELDPGFAMSYWGEAISYKHPIWNYEDHIAAQKTLARYEKNKDERHLSDKESDYLTSVRILFSQNNLFDRDRNYSDFMAKFYKKYPNDPNVGAFYALSLLGLASDFPNDSSLHGEVNNGRKIINHLYKQYPTHPGVLHYYLHYHDTTNSEIAKQALPATKIALEVMRSSSHVTHMAAHIYRRLSLWDDYILANEISVKAADDLCKLLNDYPLYACNAENKYHSLEWLQDGYLKKNQFDKANLLVKRIEHVALNDESILYKQWYYRMWARQVLLSKDWGIASIEVLPISEDNDQLYWSSYSECGALEASAFLAIHQGKSSVSQLKRLKSVIVYTSKLNDPYVKQTCEIAQTEILAEAARLSGDKIKATKYLNEALRQQKLLISTELTPSLSFLTADQYNQLYFGAVH